MVGSRRKPHCQLRSFQGLGFWCVFSFVAGVCFLPTQGALHPFPVHHIASIRIARSYDGRIQSKNNIMHMYIYIYILYTSPSLSLYIHIHTYDSYHHLSNGSYSTGERHPFSSNSSLQATSDAMGVHPIVACAVYPIIYIYPLVI